MGGGHMGALRFQKKTISLLGSIGAENVISLQNTGFKYVINIICQYVSHFIGYEVGCPVDLQLSFKIQIKVVSVMADNKK